MISNRATKDESQDTGNRRVCQGKGGVDRRGINTLRIGTYDSLCRDRRGRDDTKVDEEEVRRASSRLGMRKRGQSKNE